MADFASMQVAIASNPPGVFSSLDALLAGSTAHCSGAALLDTARMVLSLMADALKQGTRLARLSAARRCAVLLLCNSNLARLAMTMQQSELHDMALALPEGVCPQLRSASEPQLLQTMGSVSALYICLSRQKPRQNRSIYMACTARWQKLRSIEAGNSAATAAAVSF